MLQLQSVKYLTRHIVRLIRQTKHDENMHLIIHCQQDLIYDAPEVTGESEICELWWLNNKLYFNIVSTKNITQCQRNYIGFSYRNTLIVASIR